MQMDDFERLQNDDGEQIVGYNTTHHKNLVYYYRTAMRLNLTLPAKDRNRFKKMFTHSLKQDRFDFAQIVFMTSDNTSLILTNLELWDDTVIEYLKNINVSE